MPMPTIFTAGCILIAFVYVMAKMLLQHQRDEDRAMGLMEPEEHYTIRGVLKMMREERKERKRGRIKDRMPEKPEPDLRVQQFTGADSREQED